MTAAPPATQVDADDSAVRPSTAEPFIPTSF